MTQQTELSLKAFLTHQSAGPYTSLYLPLTTADPTKNRLVMKNALAHAKDVMTTAWPDTDWAPYAAALNDALAEPTLQNGTAGAGVGILTDGDQTFVQPLAFAVKQTAMVTALPQILPLVKDAQRHVDFALLVLQTDQIALYTNRGETLRAIDLPAGAPTTLKGTLGTEVRGGELNSVTQGRDTVSYHGHNEPSAEAEIDARRYYQAVDQYVMTTYSNPHQRRLVLFGLPQNIARFRAVSRNSYLSGTLEVAQSPAGLDDSAINAALNPLRTAYAKRVQEMAEAELENAQSNGRYCGDLSAVLDALASRALALLVIQAGARVNGRMVDGTVDRRSEQAQHNNLLNDLADLTVEQGGTVRILPQTALDVPVAGVARFNAEA